MLKIFSLLILAGLYCSSLSAQVSFGNALKINDQWKFRKGDIEGAENPSFNDKEWRELDLPHDWSIEGPYSPHHASATGYLPGGIAWYRKNIEVPKDKADRKIYIYFEGIYRNGEVFVNGQLVGMRPNGYISYMYDITPYLDFGEENTVAVRVDHSKSIDSRWYTGSGIYRDVYLIDANPVHIAQWGVFYQATNVNPRNSEIEIETRISNTTVDDAALVIEQEIYNKNNQLVASQSDQLNADAHNQGKILQNLKVRKPHLWSLENPYLYRLETKVFRGNNLIDQTTTPMGIRSLEFDPDTGFALNSKNMKVKGVCLHHDAGTLGSAVPREVWTRRLLKLKSLGVNAIRTSHNPQAPDLYSLCDEIGLLVLNEAFDEWEFPKKKWVDGWNVGEPAFQGPYEFFEEWGERDLRDMILRDRNHPSVFMWSIGNEVDYPNDPYSHPVLDEEGIQQQHTKGYQPDQPNAERLGAIAKRLAAVVREYDPSRPVTAGLAGPVMSNKTDYPGALDVVGYNYTERRYEQDHETYPNRVLYGSENRHDYAAWKAVRDNDFIFGQFLWTGINYLGESFRWPSRGFTTGLLDLAGFVKPRGYYRKSLWTKQPMIYAGSYPVPHGRWEPLIDAPSVWNYEEGDTIRVVSYTNCETARLFLNGKEVGKEQTRDEETGVITWDVVYQPGILEVKGFNGQEMVVSDDLETTERPHAIDAKKWNDASLQPGDVVQIELRIVDAKGRLVYLSDNEITCRIEGSATLLGLESSDPTDMGNYNDNKQRVYHGTMIAYIKFEDHGFTKVSFSSPWLKGAEVVFGAEN
ncbi:sugar-binding domain-containing protein [Marinilabilia rubra]|uniref:Glycoside hydrolase family 2 n=1 Tax=Marinilabilia rubra TaxID=2162893 RepID=A0A2U2B5Z1_9BACT|nr:sugar-binding domain-containing protein [Marinilabilia rubra]PWD98475.1 glycoside hydrolase family 2 [Marinilabilia rubra]